MRGSAPRWRRLRGRRWPRSGRGRSMRGSAPRWRRLRGRRWPRSARWKRGWRESAMSAETRDVEVEEEAGGMIAHLKEEEAAEEDGGTTALLQDEAHLQGGAHHPEEVILLQDVEVLLRRGLDCSWHQGLLEVQVEEVEVGGESVRSRRRNLGGLEAGTEIDPPGVTRLQGGDEEVDVVTLLQGEALLQEGVHLQEEAALLAGMRGEAMQEVGDAEVEVEALLLDVALHQEGVLLQGEVPLQDAEEVLMMEVDPGGLGLAEVMTGVLQEGDRLQGEDPLLVGALRHAVGLLQEEEAHLQEGATRHAGDLLLAEMRAAATEEPGGEEVEVGEVLLQDVDLHLVVDLHQEEAHLPAAMDLPGMTAPQTGGVTVQQAMTELHQDPTTAHRLDLTTELLPNPLDSLTRAGPRWPSVKPTWSSCLGQSHFKDWLAHPWPPPLLPSGLFLWEVL